jgi:ribosomal protein L7/L12
MPDLNKIIEDLSSLTVVEAAELSKQLEEKCEVVEEGAGVLSPPLGIGFGQKQVLSISLFITMVLELLIPSLSG